MAASGDDGSLARAAALGDRAAYDALVRRHGPAMYRWARRMLPDPGDAEDAVQDALVAAWRSLDHWDQRSTVSTWLFAITAHKAQDIARRRRPEPVDDATLASRAAPPEADPAVAAVHHEMLHALEAALLELPYRQRACWLLKDVEGLSQAEVGQVLRMSTDTVRGNLRRARLALRGRMRPWR